MRASLSVFVCHCDFACVFMSLKSCYQTQQQHCSPPIHPPWHNSLWPQTHMTLPHCCLPLTFSSAWKAKACSPGPLWAFNCPLLAGQWRRHRDYCFIQRTWDKILQDKLRSLSSSSLFLSSWLIVWPTKEDCLKRQDVSPAKTALRNINASCCWGKCMAVTVEVAN